MTEVISVRFRSGCKQYDFAPNGVQGKMGDQVIVETAQGPEFATVTEGNHEVEDSAVVKPLSDVLRLATDQDRAALERNRKKERDAFGVCEKKIVEHGLEMKLVRVSASFDGSKIIFFFTADGRVDFRELVRDLAGVFRARIELRQIGVRDEAKMIGGLGICGRPFCCSEFLDGFMPVSIKMAKTQNLSLNPAKISGTCGRLMCCLKYEQHAYEDAAKRMPKVESFVQTPDGPGNVKSVDLLQEKVKVHLDSAAPNEAPRCYHNCEVCVLRNGKGSREGIEIPDRTARFVEEAPGQGEADRFATPPFYLKGRRLEDAPTREKIGPASGSEGKTSRRRSSRRKSGSKPAVSGQSGERKGTPPQGGKSSASGGRPHPAGSEGERSQSRPPKRPQGQKKPQPPKGEGGKAEGGGETEKRRRPHHRGGRHRNKNSGGTHTDPPNNSGSGPKAGT